MAGPGWFVTPQTTLDYMREVDRFIDAIHAAVLEVGWKGQIPPGLRFGFLRFLADWKTFYQEHAVYFWDRLSGSVADTTERYETDAAKWRETLKPHLGARADAVVFDETKRPGGPALPPLADVNGTLLIGAALAGGYLLLWRRR